jgi:3-phenylpropionate/trans-cinnamate dioxygenase ferredoxin subunit
VADYVEAARLADIPEGGMKQVQVRGDLVGLYRVGEDVYAIRDICTHEEAYLTEGEFDPEELEVECPLHGSRFNVVDGSVRILPATKPEPSYPVKIENDIVYVGLESE